MTDLASRSIDSLRPVCAGVINLHDGNFWPIAHHPHAEADCPGASSGFNYRASSDCPIRTYSSCHEVDGRFDGQFVTSPLELTAATNARQGAVSDSLRVVMPVSLAMQLFGFVVTDFSFDAEPDLRQLFDDA